MRQLEKADSILDNQPLPLVSLSYLDDNGIAKYSLMAFKALQITPSQLSTLFPAIIRLCFQRVTESRGKRLPGYTTWPCGKEHRWVGTGSLV